MARAAVIAAIKAQQQANWTTAPVIYSNDNEPKPTNGDPFVYVSFPIADGDQASLGAPSANKFRDTGTIRFEINTHFNQGTDESLQYADELAALFRAKVLTGVITYAPTPPVFLGVDGMYASWSFAVPYKFDFQE